MYRVSRLPNGLVVASAAMPHMASISLGLWSGVGGRCEPAEINGVSHFIEHMLFKGTRRRSAKEISQAVEGIGGYLNAFTGEESTCFYSKASADRVDDLLDVLMDMFLHSKFDPAEIEKERGVIREELAMYLDQPQQHVHELLNETFWPDHPLGRPLTGTARHIDSITRAQLLVFRRRNYVARGSLVCAAGNLRHEQLVRKVARYASGFFPGSRPGFLPAPPAPAPSRVRLLHRPTAQMQIALGIRACSRHDERRFGLRLLNTLLGENMSSRLFQELREDRGLVYSIHSGMSLLDDVGVLTVSAGLDPGDLVPALRLILRILARFRAAAPAPSELRRARDYVLGQIDLGLESTENQMMWLGEQWLAYGRLVSPSAVKRRLARVTGADVRRAACDFFRGDRICLAIIGPRKSDAGLARLLEV